ncbi:MAG TPA: protein kinase [Vicinamibacteria bacterium]|nr:protein kinase [Vicinamibacteria bacterium]
MDYSRLGPYRIVAPLGVGGMGEVYRATDAKLGRDVAIKVLPALVASDPDRLARFEREAKLLASLNHPNVAHVYGFESATLDDGSSVHFLAMELVEGEDLAERLKRGAIPIDETLTIARQVADALEEAHERGIVHRDLKPANVKLTPDGRAKVLDFGLAKACAGDGGEGSRPELSHSPTLTRAGTEAGVILGTAAYMSPEQARGRRVDKRADVWAFGVVLYEMLTGRRPFGGETASEILAAVIKDPADLAALGPEVPSGIRRLIDRCLRKDPRERLRDIGDARHVLEEVRVGEAAPLVTRSAGRRVASLAPWLLSAGLALTAIVVWSKRLEPSAGIPLRRFAIDLPWRSVPNWTDFDVALSPTGTQLAYYGRRDNDVDVYVRPLDGLDAVPLADAREANGMAFSPNGEWLAVQDPRGLRKVSIHGGRAQDLARIDDTDETGLSWGIDGQILIGHPSGLLRAPSSGGPAVPLTHVDASAGETGHIDPFHLPGGKHALMAIAKGAASQLAIVDLERATHVTFPLSGSRPAYSPSGHLVFRQGASVLASRFDLERLEVVGDAVPVLEHVRRGPYLAADGTMVYVPERGDSSARLVWVDRTGRPTPIPGERLDYSHLDLAGGGRQALLNIGREVHVRDIERGTRRLLSSDNASFPIWSTDGLWATYWAVIDGKGGLFRQPADGSAGPERLRAGDGGLLVASSWNSRTGELAFFDGASDIWILSTDGSARRFLAAPFNERSGRFSPDGRWMAYVSDETGSYQVYVAPYPGPGPKIAVSIDGGLSPIWSADGRELFFRRGGKVLAAAMSFTPTLTAARPVELFDGAYTLDLMGHQRCDVAPDGRFLMVENSDDYRIVVVQNWAAELNRIVPQAKAARP